MQGYPKVIATKQDFLNLLAMPEYKDQALADLQAIHDTNDSKCIRATTPINPEDLESEWHTEEIDNPMPLWRLKGFSSREEVMELIQQYQ